MTGAAVATGQDSTGVAVFGVYDRHEGSEDFSIALQTGRVLAELGYRVVNGGYGGTMLASARGAKEVGGQTVGVINDFWGKQANEFIDQVIHTKTLYERIDKLIELGDSGCVVLPGGTGTLAELALVWEFTCKKMRPARPIVCMGQFWRPLVEMMGAVRSNSVEFIKFANSPAELRNWFPSIRLA